jgi:membrane-associated protease RseP (regulator of RpoE activity)
MAANIGTPDRVLRIVIGVLLIALVFMGPRTPWGWIGIIPLVTALFNFCPLYALLGIKTRR